MKLCSNIREPMGLRISCHGVSIMQDCNLNTKEKETKWGFTDSCSGNL